MPNPLEALLAPDCAPPSRDEVEKLLGTVAEVFASFAPEDAFVGAGNTLYAQYVASREEDNALFSERDVLLAKLLELQKNTASADTPFYQDANRFPFSAQTHHFICKSHTLNAKVHRH